MDALYILGNGSIFNNDELRYSLRTLEAFLKPVGRVIVAGFNPGFLSDNTTFIPIIEANGNKEFRIASKIAAAIKQAEITKDFFFLNDDFFFTAPINPNTYPFYYKGCLSRTSTTNAYALSLRNTFNYLKNKNLPTKHFDVHTPIVYNPEKFLALEDAWQYSKTLTNGLVVKSVYANSYQIEGENSKDCKLLELSSYQDFQKAFNPRNVFSVYDKGWSHGVEDYLEMKFPNKSKYER